MLDCTTNRYADLYAPWLHRGSLIAETENLKGATVLDLCGGTGAEARRALAKGASHVTLLDLNPRCDDGRVHSFRGRAEEASSLLRGPYDIVYCRQAMGYLNLDKVAHEVHRLLRPGGKFVFNTFGKPSRFKVKQYQHDGVVYDEGHLFLFGRVIHVQHKLGAGADVSVFRYHTPQDIVEAMTPWFVSVNFVAAGSSYRWTCYRKA